MLNGMLKKVIIVSIIGMTICSNIKMTDAKKNDFFIKNKILIKYVGNEEIVKIPKGVRKIKAKAFYSNKKIKKIIMPYTVKNIGKKAFFACSNLEKIIWEKDSKYGLKKIDRAAFMNCVKLSDIKFPYTLITIDDKAFYNCKDLKKVIIPKNVKEIGIKAFYSCKKLDDIKILSDKTNIKYKAFDKIKDKLNNENKKADDVGLKEEKNKKNDKKEIKNQTNLKLENKDILGNYLGSTYPDIGYMPPNNKIDEPKPEPKAEPIKFIIENDVIKGITKEGLEIIKKTKIVKIPEGIKKIDKGVFKNLDIENVQLPSTLSVIDREAFLGNALKEISLPSTLEIIGRGAFDGNYLTELKIDNPKCKIDGIFYNDGYVNIITTNKDIKDEKYSDTTIDYKNNDLESKSKNPYGSVVNRAEVLVTYYDDNDKAEFQEKLVSKDRKNRYKRTNDNFNKYYRIDDKINVVALKNDYLHLGNIYINAMLKNKVDFHYNLEEIPLPKDEDSKKPVINGVNQPLLLIIGSITARNPDYLSGIYASDYKMNDISNKITLENEDEINVNKAGIYNLKYSVSDNEGNKNTSLRKIYVEEKDKWYSHDFYYDNDILLSLSNIGELKLNEILTLPSDKKIDLPVKSDKGEILRKIASAAFANLRIREINIPENYEEIRAMAFDSTLLKKLNLPDSIKYVGNRAFAFSEITELKLSQNLQVIGDMAFSALNISKIELPSSLKEIGKAAFSNNFKLKNKQLTIPESVKIIKDNAFENCKLEKVIFNEGIEEIGHAAFMKNDIKEAFLPNSLIKLAPDAFKQNGISGGGNYIKVKLYTKDGQNPHNFESNIYQAINPKKEEELTMNDLKEEDFEINNGELKLSKNGKEKFKKIKKRERLIIPRMIKGENVTKIADFAFMSKQIKALELPDTLEIIGNSAFMYNKFSELSIPKNVHIIDESAFFENKELTALILPEGLEEIRKNAFWKSNLEEVILPSSIKNIGENAFKSFDKSKLVKLKIKYSPLTSDFINNNKDRTDFILEVEGLPKAEVELQNPLTKYGISSIEYLKFKINGVDKKPTVSINGQNVTAFINPRTKVITVSAYDKFVNMDGEYTFTFTIDGKIYEKKVKLFKPDDLQIENPMPSYKYDNGLEIKFKKTNKEFSNIKLYRKDGFMPHAMTFTFDNEIGILKIDKDNVENYKEYSDDTLIFNISGDYHKKTLINIKLEVATVNSGLNFEKPNIINDDVAIYKSSKIDDDLFNEIKENYENDRIEITAGRSTYSKNYVGKDALYDDEYAIEFDENTKTIELAIKNPPKWEELSIAFGSHIFKYDIEDDLSLSSK